MKYKLSFKGCFITKCIKQTTCTACFRWVMIGTQSPCYWETVTIGAEETLYMPWEKGKRLFRYGSQEPEWSKGYFRQFCDTTNLECSFPPFSASLLLLTASYLGKEKHGFQSRQYSSCWGPDIWYASSTISSLKYIFSLLFCMVCIKWY